jgi:3-deoxy-7-phosphoheptulonate synthase
MIIVLKPEATRETADALLAKIAAAGLKPLYLPGTERVVLGALGDERVLHQLQLESHPMVERVQPILSPYKLVSREMRSDDTLVRVGKLTIGGDLFAVIAGPCAVESAEQMHATARAVKEAGATALRGGAFKPRTSPYAFQGLGVEGLRILRDAGREVGLPVVTEVVEPGDAEIVAEYADCLQVGARNMASFSLLKAVGQTKKPVLLKRGMSARLEELLLAAEYIAAEGNEQIVLCERGVRTFETAMRNTLDLAAVPYLKARTHLPVMIDPSHGTGARELVSPMTKAAAACGADGVIVEVHENPEVAKSDGKQSLFPAQLQRLMKELAPIVHAMGRRLS